MFSMETIEKMAAALSVGDRFGGTEAVAYHSVRSGEALVRVGGGRAGYWALNPYSGCEHGCAFCRSRQEAPFREADWRLFEGDIHVRSNAPEVVTRALRDGLLSSVPVALGTSCDPWQPAEKRFGVTRQVLEQLALHGGVNLRAQTRSPLVTRDIDLLLAIGRRGRASVAISIASPDRRLNRLLEPSAPVAERRFAAMEALARAGVKVGILVAPVLPGLNDSYPALEKLLSRAREFGASFAGAMPLSMSPQDRARLVRHFAVQDPERATRYDRLFARSVEREPAFASELAHRFAEACERARLVDIWSARATRRQQIEDGQPRQLSLF
jgi:DNA repair photolyase